jgi:2-polyprenyl-6-methoxyphenol hydroxylase-like FAD-dependent oxidoreductase
LEQVTTDVPPDVDAPYILCALVADPARLRFDMATVDDAALPGVVAGLVAGWHPDLRRLLAESDPASRGSRIPTVSPELPAWPSSQVTVLGDAIHTMPPTGGLGGNAALRDARLLARQLAAVAHGKRDLLPAVAEYEAAMRDHGYAAIRGALRTRDQMLSRNQLTALASRTWFRLCKLSPALRRRTFRGTLDDPAAPRSWERAA